MQHLPICLKDISLSFAHKTCFENFSAQVPFGSRIALIGKNGSGKSTLLNCFRQFAKPTSGIIYIPDDVKTGYVPQIIEGFYSLSGAQRFNKALSEVIGNDPNVLLLDEPTNHLDKRNKATLLRFLNGFTGTLIIATHDRTLLNQCVDTLWHIVHGQIHIFKGKYDDLIQENLRQRNAIQTQVIALREQKKKLHDSLMQEQIRAKKSREKGQKSIDNRKWPTIVSKTKMNSANTHAGKKRALIDNKKHDCVQQLSDLYLFEAILPTFHLTTTKIGNELLISVSNGEIGYKDKPSLLKNIGLSVFSDSRIAILGNNGCGKSTLIKALLNSPTVICKGGWTLPKNHEIGFLDQHYATLNSQNTVLETIEQRVPSWSAKQIRFHLSDFLFRQNEEVNATVSSLSGGEKARLSLAQMAALVPKLLILDEITNNLDLSTKSHVIDVLIAYPGAMLVVSHDQDFLKAINIKDYYELRNNSLFSVSL